MKKNTTLAREQLDATLKAFRPSLNVSVPSKGWIRAIRDVLGMNGRQFADRLDVTRQRSDQIENEECSGSLTLKAMRRIAESLDCVFVYGLVPRTSLDDIVRNQAKNVATKRLAWADHTMSLEGQSLTQEENKKILADMIEALMETLPANLWDD
jgi:predicted DNA-binding mobile mystery protein A